jgi:2,4-dienoyl-CoA reductase-like NADH-dependent reductase (Old Yellow Enzyme family)
LAKQAGFDGADLKLCHGYLFSKMLNRQNVERPGWNFGGDTLYKRMEFIRRILGRVRQELGADDNFVLASRISTYLGLENEFGAVGGSANEDLELHDATGLVDQLLDLGVRIINISGGVPAQTPKIVRPTNENPEGVFAHFRRARALMQHINQRALVIGSGYSWLADGKKLLPKGEAEKYLGIERLEDDLFHRSLLFWAATNVLNGWTDMAGTGRQLLADPLFPQKKLDVDSGVFANWCAACGGCSEMLKGFHPHVGCVVHDEEARLFYNACRELAAREKEIQLGTATF